MSELTEKLLERANLLEDIRSYDITTPTMLREAAERIKALEQQLEPMGDIMTVQSKDPNRSIRARVYVPQKTVYSSGFFPTVKAAQEFSDEMIAHYKEHGWEG